MAYNRTLIPQYVRCLLWVKSGHVQCETPCPLYPQERTLTTNSIALEELID